MPSPSPRRFLDAALAYAANNWPVLPLAGKIPLGKAVPHGCLDASTKPAVLKRWWTDSPAANIGLATGHAFFVLDVDLKSHGDDTLESLEIQHGKLPDTLQQQTGTGGRHYLFSLPSFPIRNSAGSIGAGLDIRGQGGYIVAPPSIHPETGREYTWDGIQEWHQQPILPAPGWLLDLIESSQTVKTTPQAMPAQIVEGGRNILLFKRAAALRRAGWERDEIIVSVAAINASRCVPPLPMSDIIRIATSAARYDPATPVADLTAHIRQENSTTEAVAAEPLPDWRPMLKRGMRKLAGGKTEPGSPYTHALNASLPLMYDPEFHGAIAMNELRRQIVIRRRTPISPEPCEWRDYHDIAYAAWCQTQQLNIAPETAAQAALMVAETNKFHPVREYLQSLEWDGYARISYWLEAYCGAESSLYVQTVGRKWLISAVARALSPGCKVDHCLILEGKQGILKSSALGVLGGDWYTDEIEDLTSKDAAQQCSRVWIVEMGELSAMNRSEKNAVKAFLTRSVDQFRPPYGRHVVQMPRQCVFCGSTNQSEYFEDDTGNRRFWPVWCEQIRIDELRRDRDQIWAEAMSAYSEGENWWLEDAAAKSAAEEAAADRLRQDPWLDNISTWAMNRLASGSPNITISDVLTHCLEKRESEWNRSDEMRISSILRACGLTRKRITDSGKRYWAYQK